MTKIHSLPNGNVNARAMLASVLEGVETDDRAVVIVLQSDGTDIRWSTMPKADLAFASMVLQHAVMCEVAHGDE